ncbi:FAD-binding domain-containing protein, partial [Tateyamaria pelophila]|uniref:FAD-binding domain-containing protein n=1 Tax=Tateyamaria pelophila TaxID=328415 RepID=UPI001CBF7B0C
TMSSSSTWNYIPTNDASGVSRWSFTRTWVPELSDVPDEYLQEPWRWAGAGQVLDRTYPAPIVDVASAARAARDKVWAVRRGGAFRAEAADVIKQHASRKDRQGYFVNDRAPKTRKAGVSPARDERQLGFDF